MKENRQLRWAMPGTGVIANEMAQALQAMDRTLDAVGNRTYGKAVSFGSKYGGKQVCADYHQMFTDLDIDAICLTPHNTHMAYLEQALSQGKHVLCEKSIPLNSGELDRAMKLAEERRVVLADPSKFSTITAASVLPLDRAGIIPGRLDDRGYPDHTDIKEV